MPLDEPVPASGWAQHVFGQRLELLEPDTRRALLIATAAGGDEMLVLARALAGEGLSAAALEPAEPAGLVQLSPDRFGFRHPLVRSAVYHLAAPPDVRSAHAAVAAALVEPERADQRAWHLASAAVEPDAAVAAAMEQAARSADRPRRLRHRRPRLRAGGRRWRPTRPSGRGCWWMRPRRPSASAASPPRSRTSTPPTGWRWPTPSGRGQSCCAAVSRPAPDRPCARST